MRNVILPALGRPVSAIGFGCASLGSRIGRRRGTRALHLAYDLGVTWFDVAPPYGDGEAEAILGDFLHGRRDRVVICTKVGIERPEIARLQRLARVPARILVGAFPSIRKRAAKARSIGRRPPLDAPRIRRSVEESLRRLRTDYIDVLALHEPSVADCRNPEALNALEGLVRSGMVRTLSIAGDVDAILAGLQASHSFQAIQLVDNYYQPNLLKLRQTASPQELPFAITHSILAPNVVARFSNDHSKSREIGLSDTSLLLRHALATNPNGVVLSSMYSTAHIRQNCIHASEPLTPSTLIPAH